MPSTSLNFKVYALGGCLVLAIMLANCSKSLNSTTTPQRSAIEPPAPTGTPPGTAPLIVAFGDSLTAGLGLEEGDTYPTLLQKRLIEAGYDYAVINAGVSGETSAGGVRRIDSALKGNVKILILELGSNDGLRGQPIAELKSNLSKIIEAAQKRKITVVLAGMEAPTNFGAEYTAEFRKAFQDLQEKYNLALIPFFLADVAGISELNQADGIHPNAKGEEIVANNVWQVLEPLLAK
jgi:acyl-CoA thioesterase I